MIQKMNENKKRAIMDIIQSSNTIEKAKKFMAYKFLLSDCRIFLFDEKYSNFDESVKNKKIGTCGVFGIGDYTKTWILDSGHLSERSLVRVGTVSYTHLDVYKRQGNEICLAGFWDVLL